MKVEMLTLKGKTAVITGSTKGIGLAIAMELAGEGAQILINHRKQDNEPSKINNEFLDGFRQKECGQPYVCEADLTDEKDVIRLAETADKVLGKIDIWVNNVGSHIVTPAMNQSKDNWEYLFAINSTTTFLGCREAAKKMRATGGGSIINISSKMGLVGSPDNACYCAAKAAVIMMTRCFAAEWAAENIRVNAIAPGVTWTNPTEKIIEGKPDLEAALHYRIPMERFAKPEEIAKVAIFLASDASSYVTGETIVCDGGWIAHSDFAGIPPKYIDSWREEFPRKRSN